MNALFDFLSKNKFVRFLIAGFVNTAITYLLYLLLLRIFEYRVAYTASYVTGITIAYTLNLKWVFEAQHSPWKMLTYPLIYLIQYGVGFGVLTLSVRMFLVPKEWALMFGLMVNIPLGFFLNKLLLTRIYLTGGRKKAAGSKS